MGGFLTSSEFFIILCKFHIMDNLINEMMDFKDELKGMMDLRDDQIVKCKEWDHIFMSKGLELDFEKPVYKYMPCSRFIDNVKSNELVFVSPETWSDPFERRFWNAKFQHYTFTQPQIACMCLTTNASNNEEAAWNLYSIHGEKTLRISFCLEKLLDILDEYADMNQCAVYIGNVKYLSKKDIENLHKNPGMNVYFPQSGFGIGNYLRLMCLKRAAFAFENEIRIFIVKDLLFQNNDVLLRINKKKLWSGLVTKIMLAPLPPFGYNSPLKSWYRSIQNAERSIYKKELEKLSVVDSKNICQSLLYMPKRPICIP